MGRGRAKAKQTRVARDLKYRAVDTDFASLERELRSDPTGSTSRLRTSLTLTPTSLSSTRTTRTKTTSAPRHSPGGASR
ncbi:DUF3073 domain-containing protein [Tessaracoccus sp.]